MLTAITSITAKVILPCAIPVLAVAESFISPETGVPLTIVCAVGGACWYLNGRFASLESGVSELKAMKQSMSDDIREIRQHIDQCNFLKNK